ncbi:hypothetical protein R3P38DRAFT_2959722 [Favolaschia claudopus]|uniref:DUF6534 domain-containing protein n=1 Tax=Favolaschia claudopus TaxID=2862362 RepID=A0AAW0B9A6_9AGAR
MAAGQIAISYGVQITASWFNMLLYTLEIVMCLRYFQRSAFRPVPHKIGIGAMLLFDTICTIAVDAQVFVTFLIFIGKEPLESLKVPASLSIFFTYCTAVIEQLFLCHLYFILTRKRFVSIFLAALGLTHLGITFGAATWLVKDPANPFIYKLTAIGAIACVVVDLLIALCLGYEWFKIRRSRSSNSNLLRRVFFLSITSGGIVASTTLIMMILFLKGSIGWDFLFSCQGRIYALCLLFNFLSGSGSSSSSGGTFDIEQFPAPLPTGEKRGSASLHSNTSEDFLITKELPPLPDAHKRQRFTLTHTFSPSGVVWSLQSETPPVPPTPVNASQNRIEGR